MTIPQGTCVSPYYCFFPLSVWQNDELLVDAFVQAMEKFGFPGLSAFDIVETGKQVREEIAAKDPEKAAGL